MTRQHPSNSPLPRLGFRLRNRLAASVRRSPVLRGAYARGKAAGRVLHGDAPSLRALTVSPRDELRRSLAQLLVDDGAGLPVAEEELTRLRRLAVQLREGDHDGLTIATLSVLAGRFDDPAARSWLPIAMAEAGRFAEAAERELTFTPGRPRAQAYPILVTALHQLGRVDEAEQLMMKLQRRYRALRSDFVHIWGDDPLSTAYRELYDRSPAHSGVLPVFQHLPFCAGSSMQYSLKQVVPWARTLQIGRRWGMLQIEQARKLPADVVRQLMMVHQHHPFALELAGRPLSHFTVLRDPVSQIRSGFFKRAARDKIVSTRDTGSATFAEHAEYTMRAGLTNMLTRMIITTHPALKPVYDREFSSSGAFTMISHEEDMFWLEATRRFSEERLLAMARETLEENFHVVGTMAHLSAGHLACTAAVGVPVAHAIGHRGRSGQPPVPEPASVEGRLRDANSVDQQLYDEYTARFERDYPALIAAVEGGGDHDQRSGDQDQQRADQDHRSGSQVGASAVGAGRR